MEKVSIVRRRLEVMPTQAELRARQRIEEREMGLSTALAVLPEAPEAIAPSVPAVEPFSAPLAEVGVTVDLTPEVKDELWSGGHIDETPSGKRHFIVEAQRDRQADRIVLKLEFMKPEYYLRLLTTEEVCEMLHVSRSSLYQYARQGDLRTYRMGRHLRYRFQDVLDFITGRETQRS